MDHKIPTADPPAEPKKRRKSVFLHMRATPKRRRIVLGLLRHFSVPAAPATATAVVEAIFDAGVEALRAQGVEPDRVDEAIAELGLKRARSEILRAAGFEVDGEDEDDAPEEEGDAPAVAQPPGPVPLHLGPKR